jgi:hypothetical protein
LAYSGRFRPKNPTKYKGDPTKIVYRSMWEFKFFRYIDEHPDVIWWASEEYAIPYMSPLDNKRHRYFPDVVVNRKTTDGSTKTLMIEIKPKSQTKPPDIKKKNDTKTGRVSRRYLNEVKSWGINEAKWKAAQIWCAQRGWEFHIYTEDQLGIK